MVLEQVPGANVRRHRLIDAFFTHRQATIPLTIPKTFTARFFRGTLLGIKVPISHPTEDGAKLAMIDTDGGRRLTNNDALVVIVDLIGSH